jgi:vitamin B12 transporter
MKLSGSTFAFALYSCCANVLAQVPLESLRVFSERAASLRSDGTQAIGVITRSEIERRGVTTLGEALREMAGLHVDRVGPSGPANVYIRGAEPNHTVVLVDGIRVNDPTDPRGGSFDLGAIALSEVERIEVLRGSSSAQFGADAMGGVINIVTRRAGDALQAALDGGTQDYAQASARISLPALAGSATLGISHVQEGREEEGGRSRRRMADASWARVFSDDTELRVHARGGTFETSLFPESSGGVRLAALRDLERREGREGLAAAHFRHGTSNWRWILRAATTWREEDRDAPAVAPGPGGFVPATLSRTELKADAFVAELAYAERASFEPSIGVEARREDGRRESTLFIPDPLPASFRMVRDTRAAYGQLQARPLPGLTLLAAVRRDDVDPGGARTTRSAGARQQWGEGHSVRLHWSEGFKAPSFYALADPLVGNPRLRPETSRGLEAGWEMRLERGRIEATVFTNRYRDLVDFDPETFRMVNRVDARTRGAELQSSWRATESLRLEASYTFTDAELDDGTSLRNRPRHRGSLAMSREVGAWSLRAAAIHVGASSDFSVPTGTVTVPGFTTLDASARWRRGAWSGGVAIDNLADRRYESFVGFTSPGRRLRVFAQAVF